MSSIFSERENASAPPPAYQFRDEDSEALWSGLATATDSARLCHCWLGLQCHLVQGTQAGLLLLKNEAGDSYVPAAVWPDPQRDLAFLAEPAQEALAQRTGVVRQVAATADRQATVHIAYPIESDGDLFGVVAIEITPRSEVELRAALRQLVWGGAWLDGLCLRRNAADMRSSSQRSVLALDVLAAVQEQDGLQHASLALVNELVTRLAVDRASLGLMRGAQLEVQAISRSAWFERKSQLVVALGNAMDEALDQRATVCEPPLPERSGCIAVAQRDLSTRTGNASVCAVPLLIGGKRWGQFFSNAPQRHTRRGGRDLRGAGGLGRTCAECAPRAGSLGRRAPPRPPQPPGVTSCSARVIPF